MEQADIQPVAEAAVSENAEIAKLKKRVRSAGWAITTIGYLYLLFAIIAVLGLVASLGTISFLLSKGSTPGAGMFAGLLIFMTLIAVIPVVTGVMLCVSLVVLGRRMVSVKKGLLWRAGEIKLDSNIKKYFLITTVLAGFLLGIQFFGELSILDLVLAGALFLYSLSGFLALKKLFTMPEFTTSLQATTYKTGPTFWGVLVGVVIVLQIGMVFLPTMLKSNLDKENLPADSNSSI